MPTEFLWELVAYLASHCPDHVTMAAKFLDAARCRFVHGMFAVNPHCAELVAHTREMLSRVTSDQDGSGWTEVLLNAMWEGSIVSQHDGTLHLVSSSQVVQLHLGRRARIPAKQASKLRQAIASQAPPRGVKRPILSKRVHETFNCDGSTHTRTHTTQCRQYVHAHVTPYRESCKMAAVRGIAGTRFHKKGTGRGANDVSIDYCTFCFMTLTHGQPKEKKKYTRAYAKLESAPKRQVCVRLWVCAFVCVRVCVDMFVVLVYMRVSAQEQTRVSICLNVYCRLPTTAQTRTTRAQRYICMVKLHGH